MSRAPDPESTGPIASNRKALADYHILEHLEVGIVLLGTEVKSLRDGKCSLKESYARFDKGQLFLYNAHIAAYPQGGYSNHEPTRPRKLLLHKNQMLRFFGRVAKERLTIVPLKIYFKHGLAKCEIALAKSKRSIDRRDDIKKRIVAREIDRAIKNRNQR